MTKGYNKVKWTQGKVGIMTKRQRGTTTKVNKYEGALGQMVAISNVHNSEEAERQGRTIRKRHRGRGEHGQRGTRITGYERKLLIY